MYQKRKAEEILKFCFSLLNIFPNSLSTHINLNPFFKYKKLLTVSNYLKMERQMLLLFMWNSKSIIHMLLYIYIYMMTASS